MLLARVLDHLIATRKEFSFEGHKLLLVQPVTPEGSDYGEPLLAIDGADAGIGDLTLIVTDGWAAMHVMGRFNSPVDAAVIGVVDEVRLDDGC